MKSLHFVINKVYPISTGEELQKQQQHQLNGENASWSARQTGETKRGHRRSRFVVASAAAAAAP